MKKFTTLIITLFLMCMSAGSLAQAGDIAGEYYCTDIKTYLNGAEIETINIGEQTLINAEAMYYYCFNVNWNESERTLSVYESQDAGNGIPPAVSSPQLPVGTPLGYYYETDIVTYLDNEPIKAFNTDGKTYIPAQEMRKSGYEINWYEQERKVEITSPMRGGYVYDIGLSYYDENTENYESTGNFSISYTKTELKGSDDTRLFNMNLHSSGKDYVFTVSFYQNEGLFNSSRLIEQLQSLCYDGFSIDNPCDKSEKYDTVNSSLSITINGNKSSKVSITSGAGNGHRDFYITAEDLPKLKKDEIEEITFSFGQPSLEYYDIKIPDYVLNGPMVIAEKLKKFPYDYMQTYYTGQNYYIFFMKESETLGIVKDRLYLVNKNTGEVSDDILQQVRSIDGFNYDIINPFSFNTENNENKFYFSCNSPEKTMDFYLNIDNGKVYPITD